MATQRKRKALYFTGVTIIRPGRVALTGHYYALEDSNDRRTALRNLHDSRWGSFGDVSGIIHAIRSTEAPDCQLLLLERSRGLYRVVPPNTIKFERINEEREGFLMDLRQIARKWYTVGGHHQIYRQDNGKWNPIDAGIYAPGDEGEAKILLSIDGISDTNIYTVGFGGVIFHFDGTTWKQIDSPTNCGLQRVLCVSNEEVYVCGYANTLFRGNTSGWKPLTEPDESTVYWDMAFFKGKVYICSKKKLFVIKDDQLEEIKIPVPGPLGFYRMDCDEHELWTCGNECLLKFDGKSWKQYIFPDNQ